jgi:polysaccharide export outer membrane protein
MMKKHLAYVLFVGAVLTVNAQNPPAAPGTTRNLSKDKKIRLLLDTASRSPHGSPTLRTTNAWEAMTPLEVKTFKGSAGAQTLRGGPPTDLPAVTPPNGSALPASTPAAISGSKYSLREGDLIEVRVYQEDDLTARVRLNQEGEVTLPLLGIVNLQGKSIEEARQQVQVMLGKDYLVNPQVTIMVVEYAKRRFAVMGQVQQPGFYNIPENEKLNILQAISMAGGFTRLANTGRVTIKRNVNGVETVFQVNAQSMGTDKGARLIEVLAEDTIIVGQRVF